MNILILGGTRFVGRHLTEAALRRGHRVTLFHRGQSNPDLFPEVERILGDRDGGLNALGDRKWDAVIDTCGYVPRVVRQSAECLSGHADTYLFISTISVYDTTTQTPLFTEEGPLLRFAEPPESEEITGETYGAFKVECEEAIDAAFEGRKLHVRPGLIIGPWDTTDRFTYWVDRLRGPEPVLVPETAEGGIQIIDGRDLAEFCLHLLEGPHQGRFNAVSRSKALPFAQMVDTIQSALNAPTERVRVSAEFLAEQDVKPWADLPLWVPPNAGFGLPVVSADRALANGLSPRPLEETVRDLDAWDRQRERERDLNTGMSREREAELIALSRG